MGLYKIGDRDGVSGSPLLDSLSSALTVDDMLSNKLNRGVLFGGSLYNAAVTNGSYDAMSFSTGTSYVHLRVLGASTAASLLSISTGHTETSAGTAAVVKNFNQNSSSTSGVTMKTGVTVSSDGTYACRTLIPGALRANASGGDSACSALILKPQTKYLIKVLNLTSGTITVQAKVTFYEETADAS